MRGLLWLLLPVTPGLGVFLLQERTLLAMGALAATSLFLLGLATRREKGDPLRELLTASAVLPQVFLLPALVVSFHPWVDLPPVNRLLIGILLTVVSALFAARALGYGVGQIGLGPGAFLARFLKGRRLLLILSFVPLLALRLAIQVGVAASGLGLAWLERTFLPLPTSPFQPANLPEIWLLAGTFAVGAFAQELLFRGVLQRAGIRALGPLGGLIYAALAFGLVVAGGQPWTVLVFMAGVGLVAGVIVHLTGSILGMVVAQTLVLLLRFDLLPDPSACGVGSLDGIMCWLRGALAALGLGL